MQKSMKYFEYLLFRLDLKYLFHFHIIL